MGGLIERAAETAAARETVDAASRGAGGTLLVRGPAGIGKTAVLTYVEELARSDGFTVLRSCATPVSTTLTDSVVRNWLTPLLRGARPGVPPFDGPAAPLLTGRALDLATLDYAVTWALESLAEAAPVLLVADDLHWADERSLQLLDLLATRLHTMRATLVTAVRTGEPTEAPDVLGRLATRARVVEPRPLSYLGVEQVRRSVEPAPGVATLTVQELHRRTGGIPFLLHELLRTSSPEEAPLGVVESVRERLARLGQRAVEVARTTAALGEEATFDAVATLTGRTVADLADPLELLTDAGIVTLGMWQAWIAHPLIAEAVVSTMTPSERSALHRAAAAHLTRLGRPRQVVAGHLLHTLPAEDPDVVALLREAGNEALAAGVPHVAARQLLRAVGETRPEDTDPGLFVLAARAHLAAGDRMRGLELWERGVERTPDPAVRAELLADLGDAQMAIGAREQANGSFARALEELPPGSADLVRVTVRQSLARALYDGRPGDLGAAVADVLAHPPETDSHVDRRLLAIAAWDLALGNQDRERARAVALRALGGGALLAEEPTGGIGFYAASGVLSWCDAYAENLEVLEPALAEARRRGSVAEIATASYCRGFVHLRQGRLRAADADFGPALELRERGWPEFADTAVAGAALTCLALGQTDRVRALEPALRAAARRGHFVSAQASAVAGMVRATDGDHGRALADYAEAARLMGPHPDNASIVEWREASAWSLEALGRIDEARELAAVALEHARAWGAPRALGLALRTSARFAAREEAVTLLREALAALAMVASTDHEARARLDLARLLLEGGRLEREEGVDLAGSALEYGRAEEVDPVIRRATRLLVRAGQPVSDLGGLPLAALTPGERRVAELAAAGATNREIAQQLFVTVKAVEWHLSNAYRKLGISSRTGLAQALYGESGPSNSSLM